MAIRGYLLKRNKEHRKANLLGAKYKRRWVELTADTLVHASSQQELLTGKVQIFSLHELVWIKTDGDNKFQVKFPERVLTFKIEGGSSSERDKWVEALEQAKQNNQEEHRRKGSADKLKQLRKEAEELLLDPSSSDGSFTSTSAHRAASQGPTGLGLLAAAATSLGPGSSRVSGAGPAPLGACLTSSRTTETGGRPLSPRSLLASAKAGSAFVNNSSLCGAGSLFCSPAGGLGWDASPAPQEASAMSIEDGREHEGSDVKLGSHVAAAGLHPQAPACVGTGSLELAQVNQQEVLQDWDKEEINSSSSSSSSPSSGGTTAPAAGAAAMRQDSGGSGASNTGTPGSKRRESLQRRLTPGVMLINTSLPPTPTHTAALERVEPLQAAAPLDTSSSGCCTPHGSCPQPKYNTEQHSSHTAAAHAGAGIDEALCDEILRLDPDEVGVPASNVKALISSTVQAAAMYSTTGRLQCSDGMRPGSAPHYRPGTPLKSCLRGSNSNSSDALHQLSSQTGGSMSTPASSTAVAAAAAAAVASLGLHPGTNGASGSQRRTSGTYRHSSAKGKPSNSNEDSSQLWVDEDWDQSSDDGEACGSVRDRAAGGESGHKRSIEGRFGPVQRSNKPQSGQRAAGYAVYADGAPGHAVKGVAADGNWLDDDFDSY